MEEQNKRMPRGLVPSPEEALRTARAYVPKAPMAIPTSFLQWPITMSYWGNDEFGDCVTAEEAFAKAAAPGYYFIPEDTVIGWARRNGYLNGAACYSVLSTMRDKGIDFSLNTLFDGDFSRIGYEDSVILRDAIYHCGPVKLAIDSGYMNPVKSPAKGNMTPGKSGWALYDCPKTGMPEEDWKYQHSDTLFKIRVPDNPIIREICHALDAPILTTTLPLEEGEDIEYATDPELINEKFGEKVNLIIDGGIGGIEPSTVINCCKDTPEIIRQGKGELKE